MRARRLIDAFENPPIEQRLGQAHDKLYGQFNKILKREKPCRFNKAGECEGSRGGLVPPKEVCCTGCQHHGDKGCQTQALGCKAWTCGHMWRNLSPEAQAAWNKLREKTYRSGLSGLRDTKAQEIQKAIDDRGWRERVRAAGPKAREAIDTAFQDEGWYEDEEFKDV